MIFFSYHSLQIKLICILSSIEYCRPHLLAHNITEASVRVYTKLNPWFKFLNNIPLYGFIHAWLPTDPQIKFYLQLSLSGYQDQWSI